MNENKFELKCPDCGFQEIIPKEWKVFNSITCPKCFRNINLPWCRKGFESKPREPMVIIKLDEEEYDD